LFLPSPSCPQLLPYSFFALLLRSAAQTEIAGHSDELLRGDSRTSSLVNASKWPTAGATLEVGISCQTFFKNHLFRDFFGKRNRCNDGSRCAKCLANQDCASGKEEGTPECSNYSCRLIPEKCSGHSQCPGARKCSNDGRCILNKDWCDSDYNCSGDQRCSYNVCVDFCRYHSQCPGSQKCTNDGQCIPYKDWCDSDYNCPRDQKCSNNVCRNSCRYDRDCGVSQKCSDDICWAVA